MKKLLLIFAAGFFLLSCAKDVTTQDSKANQVEAFESIEFKALQSSYDKYLEVESSVVQVFDQREKLSETELEAIKEAFIQEISQKMFESKRKREVFLTKYPSVGEKMTSKELSDLLRLKNNHQQ